MDKVIVYSSPDDTVSVIHPQAGPRASNEAEFDFLTRLAEMKLPDKTPYIFVNETDLPNLFSKAWKIVDTAVVIDMDIAKQLHLDRMRDVRRPIMELLDVAYMRSDEIDDHNEKKRIAGRKQALRDVTNIDLSNAKTPAELVQIWPEILNE